MKKLADDIFYDDHLLFKQVASGNHTAFNELFHKYNRRLLPLILKTTGSPDTAKEVVQEIFMQIWQQREKLSDVEYPAAWITRVASNIAAGFMRKAAADNRLLDRLRIFTADNPLVATADNDLAAGEVEKVIRGAVDGLSKAEKRVYHLSREQGLTIPEIAEVLNLSPNTVKNQLVAALKVIRTALQQHILCLIIILYRF